ncbi:MAG TPA: hypothetical protein VD886_23420 [Herpetosiphonaceae bacterium]|nr:hypothetical protein [Herpetosiphonaceae bacterium]
MNTKTFLLANLMFILFGMIVLAKIYLKRRKLDAEVGRRQTGIPPELKILPAMISMVVLCTLLSCGLPLTLISNKQIAAAESAPLVQAVTADLDGQKVVVEGTISLDTPANEHGLVAFTRYSNHKSARKRRRLSESTPPLVVQLAGGPVRIENPASPSGYALDNMPERRGDPGVRTYGIVRGDRVMVIGRVVAGPEGAYLDASVVSAGDRASYIANWGNARLPVPVIGGLLVIGGLGCAYGVVQLRARKRRPGR